MSCSTATTTTFSVPPYVPPAPAQPTNVTVSNIQVTGANSWTATVSATMPPEATNAKILLDGSEISGSPVTSFPQTIQGTGPGQAHQVGVAACN